MSVGLVGGGESSGSEGEPIILVTGKIRSISETTKHDYGERSEEERGMIFRPVHDIRKGVIDSMRDIQMCNHS